MPDPVDKRFWVFTDPPFYWRGLRLLAKENLHYFQEFNQKPGEAAQNSDFADYLKRVVDKLAAEERAQAADGQPVAEQAGARAARDDD